MVKLKNPLTTEERLQIPRLLGHDSISNLASIHSEAYKMNKKDREERLINIEYKLQHSGMIEDAVFDLIVENEFDLSDSYAFSFMNEYAILEQTKRLDVVLDRKISLEKSNLIEFVTPTNTLYAMIFNIVKNAHQAEKETNVIKMSYERSRFPENPAYVPEGSQNYKEFIKISIRNEKSFSEQFLNMGNLKAPLKGERGFGLYFVGLAAKVLRSPIQINSNQSEGTNFMIYHPVY